MSRVTNRISILTTFGLVAFAACSSSKATVDATVVHIDAGPTIDSAPGIDAIGADFGLVVAVTGDPTSDVGELTTVGVPSDVVSFDVDSGSVSGDPVVRHIGETTYLINRADNNIVLLDGASLTLDQQISTGANTDPQDLAVIGTKIYVAAFSAAGVIVIDTANNNAISMIDLSSLDPADGIPDCESIAAVGGSLYVSCGILDPTMQFAPRGNGKVAVIDAQSATLTTTIDMPAENPVGFFTLSPTTSMLGGDLVIGTVPSYTDFSTGCLVRVSTGSSPTATCAVSNADLGGYVNHSEVSDDGDFLYMAVTGYDSSFNGFGHLRGFDLTSLTLWDGNLSPDGQIIDDLTTCGDGYVVVAERTTNSGGTVTASGLHVYQDATELTTSPISIGMPTGFGNNLVCLPLNTN